MLKRNFTFESNCLLEWKWIRPSQSMPVPNLHLASFFLALRPSKDRQYQLWPFILLMSSLPNSFWKLFIFPKSLLSLRSLIKVSLLTFLVKGSYSTSFYGQQCLCVENSFKNFHYTHSIYLLKGLLHENYFEASMTLRLPKPNEPLESLLSFWLLFIDLENQLRSSSRFVSALPT